MKALIYKDLTAGKSTYLLTLAVGLVIGAYGILKNYLAIIPALCIYMPIIINAISFGSESESEFSKFIFTSPISRRTYVKSKYFFPLIFSIIASLFSVFITYNLFKQIDLAFMISAMVFSLSFTLNSIQIPFIIKFGEDKGPIITVLSYFLLFMGSSAVGEFGNNIINNLKDYSKIEYIVIALIILLIGFVISYLSIRISEVIIKKKEF